MTANTVPVEDRLDLPDDAESAGLAIEGDEPLGARPECLTQTEFSGRSSVLVLVASDAREALTRLQACPTPHRLDGAPVFVQGLEINRHARRDLETGRTVRVNGCIPEDGLDVPTAIANGHWRAGQSLPGRTGVVVVT